MSRSHSTRRERGRGRDSARVADVHGQDRFAMTPRKYIDDSAYERPRGHQYDDNDEPRSRSERRREKKHVDEDRLFDRERERRPAREERARSRDTPRRRSRTPLKQTPERRTNGSSAAAVPATGPLRRQSTQPPNRHASVSPRRHRRSDAEGGGHTPGYHRRDVEPHVSARRERHASAPRDDSRALVVVDRSRGAPPRRGESVDGIVDSPRRRADPSPRRSSRAMGHTPRPSRGPEREPRQRSRSTRRREPESGRRSHRERPSSRNGREEPQGTGRYVSPPERGSHGSPRRHRPTVDATPRRSSRDAEDTRARHRRSASRHGPRDPSHPTPSRTSSRRSRHDAPVVPPMPIPPPTANSGGGSTVLRPVLGMSSARGQPQQRPASSRRSSGGIEVLGISPHPRLTPSDLVAASVPRRFEPIPTPLHVVEIREKISETKEWLEGMKNKVERDAEREERHRSRQKTRHASTPGPKHRGPADGSRETTQRSTPDPLFHPPPQPPKQLSQSQPPRKSNRRLDVDSYPTSTTATSDEPRLHPQQVPFSNKESSSRPSVNQPPRSTAGSSRHAAAAPAQPAEQTAPKRQPSTAAAAATSGAGRRRHSQTRGSKAASSVDRRPHASSAADTSRQSPSVKQPPALQQPQKQSSQAEEPHARAVMEAANTTVDEDPIFSFPSFLDGNTFHTTAALCQYNMALAEALTDDQLDVMRAVVFNHDEVAFAEILYGDDIQAELALIETTLGHSDDPKVRFEMHRLQSAAVRRFAEKCSAARAKLSTATECDLVEAVRQAGVMLERAPFGETDTMAAPY